jgi:hypothetical protein
VVDDGVTSCMILFAIAAIAERIGRFLARPELLKTMGERARVKIQAYQMRQQVERLSTYIGRSWLRGPFRS